MGFDNECIPNEALQSQCTHLYCKPCLAYVVAITKACLYDRYLVTEADAKPLVESNKVLAETIGKIVIHCLYHRSGCPWQGALSDCPSHCSSWAFGNSPVVCNRCAIQIVHRQVQEHGLTCTGVQPQAQQTEGIAVTTASGATTSTGLTQPATQVGTVTSQSQVFQTANVAIPGNNPNSQAQAVLQAASPTADQWYQQFPGYDPYQQYYPYQQPGVPTPQQPLQANTPYGTVQSQTQAQPQSLVQPLLVQAPMAVQTHNQTSVNQQLQLQPAVAPQSQSQLQAHAYPSAHGQAQFPPQAYFQAQMTQYQQPQAQQITQTQLQDNVIVQSQTQHPSAGHHHLFPQSYPHQPVLSAAPQQRSLHLQSQGIRLSQSQNHVQAHSQFPLQPPHLRLPPLQTTNPNQLETSMLATPNMISAQQPPSHSWYSSYAATSKSASPTIKSSAVLRAAAARHVGTITTCPCLKPVSTEYYIVSGNTTWSALKSCGTAYDAKS